MNPQMGHSQQPHHMGGQPPLLPQHQNVGQQRQGQNGQQQPQGPNGQQSFQGQNQMKGPQGQQLGQNQHASNEPQLAMFTFERPRNVDSWEDVRPLQEQFARADIQKVLKKLREGPSDPTTALDKIPSMNCRRIINELVDEQNTKLREFNKNMQWTIAGLKTDWRTLGNRGLWTSGSSTRQQLKRVKVILETGPSAFQANQQGKAGGQVNGMQNPSMPKQPVNMSQTTAFPSQPNMPGGQQPRPMQHPQQHPGQHMHPGQFPEQQPARMPQHPGQGPGPGPGQGHMPGPNAPPPPPPPQPHPGMMDAPPPPPHMPNGPHGTHILHPNQAPPPPQHARPQSRGHMPGMPGAFPSRMPSFDEEDPRKLKKQKARYKGNQGSSSGTSSSSSTSSTDSDEWESDSASSSPRVRSNVEDGYGYVEGHRRGRTHKHNKSHKDKSHRKPKVYHHSRSRSQSRNRGKGSRKRRDSGLIETPVISRRNSFSSKENSPRLSHVQPNVHIHIDSNKVTDERARDYDEVRERRAGHNSSPTGNHKDRRRSEKINGTHAMSRENSLDGGSGTDSYATSSAHTGLDSIFDKPERRPSMSQRRSHQKSHSHPQGGFNNPHPSNIYDDVDDRPSARYAHADDYPYESTTRRDSYFNEPSYNVRPDLPHRRNTTGNPFDTTYFPPKPARTSTFAAGMHDSDYLFHQKKQRSEREEQDELRREFAEYRNLKRATQDAQKRYTERDDVYERDIDTPEFAEFIDWKSRSARRPPLKRANTSRLDSGMYDNDYELRYTRRGPYNPFDRI